MKKNIGFSTINDKTTLLSFVPKANVIYDCGSRDALDGIELARLTGARELHVFECNPDAIKLCESNIERYGSGIKIYMNRMAVTDYCGKVRFFPINTEKTVTSAKDGNIGASSLFKANEAYPRERYVQDEIEVEAITLDAYCETHTAPDLLWMDIQGAELAAIKGSTSTLTQVKAVHTEVGFRPMYKGQPLFWDIHRALRKNFQLVDLATGRWPNSAVATLTYRVLRTGPWVANAIYVRV